MCANFLVITLTASHCVITSYDSILYSARRPTANEHIGNRDVPDTVFPDTVFPDTG